MNYIARVEIKLFESNRITAYRYKIYNGCSTVKLLSQWSFCPTSFKNSIRLFQNLIQPSSVDTTDLIKFLSLPTNEILKYQYKYLKENMKVKILQVHNRQE